MQYLIYKIKEWYSFMKVSPILTEKFLNTGFWNQGFFKIFSTYTNCLLKPGIDIDLIKGFNWEFLPFECNVSYCNSGVTTGWLFIYNSSFCYINRLNQPVFLFLTIRQAMNLIILAFLLFSPLFLVETQAGSNCRCGVEGGSDPDYIIYGGGEVEKVLSIIKYLFFI